MSVKENDVIGNFFIKFINNAVRRFNEAEVINFSEVGKRANEADIGPFRSFDGAHPAVVRDVNVANFEASAFAREAAGS